MAMRKRAQRGTVQLGVYRGRYRLRWTWEGKQRFLAIGPIEDGARVLGNRVRALIEADLYTGNYDPSLGRYKSEIPLYAHSPSEPDNDAPIGLLGRLGAYIDQSSKRWKENTLLKNQLLARLIEDSLNGDDKPLDKVNPDYLEKQLGQRTKQVRDCLNLISASIGESHPLGKQIKEHVKTLPKPKWMVDPSPNAFSPSEKLALLDALEGWNEGKRLQIARFIKLMLLTGCRPSEALGLFPSDFMVENGSIVAIHFQRNMSYRGGKAVLSQGSKNNKKRKFPVSKGSKLEGLCKSLKGLDSQSFCFEFNYPNFRAREWKGLIRDIKPGATPYNLRDTFITDQIVNRIPVPVIALWCDTSTTVIESYYLDKLSALAVSPVE
ncbi:MAG: hypothetical protein Fur0042_12480 [Cyanophyceae cyanobacterium]